MGSQRKVAGEAVQYLEQTGRVTSITVRAEDLIGAWIASTSWVRTLSEVSSRLADGGSVALRLDASRLTAGAVASAEMRSTRDAVVARLGDLVSRVVSTNRPQAVVIVGGDTAFALLTTMGAAGIVLRAEPLPGMPVGTIDGGALDGVPIATKAGAFGDSLTLARITNYFASGRAEEWIDCLSSL